MGVFTYIAFVCLQTGDKLRKPSLRYHFRVVLSLKIDPKNVSWPTVGVRVKKVAFLLGVLTIED